MIVFVIFLLSTAFLPPAKILVGLALVVIGVGFLMRTFFIRIYAKAQVALKETLTKDKGVPAHDNADEVKEKPSPELPFDHAAIKSVLISSLNPFIGKAIRDTHLRAHTGCSIIAVRRANHTELSPSPEWLFEPDDEIMLLGSDNQLEQGRRWLETGDQ